MWKYARKCFRRWRSRPKLRHRDRHPLRDICERDRGNVLEIKSNKWEQLIVWICEEILFYKRMCLVINQNGRDFLVGREPVISGLYVLCSYRRISGQLRIVAALFGAPVAIVSRAGPTRMLQSDRRKLWFHLIINRVADASRVTSAEAFRTGATCKLDSAHRCDVSFDFFPIKCLHSGGVISPKPYRSSEKNHNVVF